MPKKHPLVAIIETRIAGKEEELAGIDAELDKAQDRVRELTVRRTAVQMSIDADKAALRDATPKMPRARKAQTIGDQIAQGG